MIGQFLERSPFASCQALSVSHVQKSHHRFPVDNAAVTPNIP
jgi:hypothetical protein